MKKEREIREKEKTDDKVEDDKKKGLENVIPVLDPRNYWSVE